jgi:hypothetical protein
MMLSLPPLDVNIERSPRIALSVARIINQVPCSGVAGDRHDADEPA